MFLLVLSVCRLQVCRRGIPVAVQEGRCVVARLDIRVNGRVRFSNYVEDSFVLTSEAGEGGSVSVQATIAPKPVKAAVVRPTRPVAPKPVVPKPEPEPVAPKPEPEVVTPKPEPEVVEPESGGGAEAIDGGTVDPESGVITDPASGEVVGLVDGETGEVTDQSGEVVGTLDQETGEVTDESGEVVATVDVDEV